jgi:L-malate glycosyltransferase
MSHPRPIRDPGSSSHGMRQLRPDGAGTRRILEVLFSFRIGGSEVVGLELAHQLARSGAQVLCTALDGPAGPLRERCAELGIEVIDLGIPTHSILGRNGLSVALTRKLKSLSLDAIHMEHLLALNKLGLPARMAGIPRIVVTEHSDAQLRESMAGRFRLRFNWRLAHHITVIHDGIKRYLVEELNVPDSHIVVIPNGIELSRWHRTDRSERRRDLGLGSAFTFIFVGRVVEVKDVPGLISAFLVAQSRLPQPARLLIIGDGPDIARCRSLLAGHSFGNTVTLLGEQQDTRRYLAAADVFLMNSRSEGTPRALLEAMAMGLPAICPRVGGIPEMLDGRGWLTAPGQTDSLVAAIVRAAADPANARALGELARSFVAAHYDSQQILRRYESLLVDCSPRNLRTSEPPANRHES